MTKPRIYTMSFARVYLCYVAKAEKKGRTKAEVDQIICWLTGYNEKELQAQLENQTDVETFIAQSPRPHPSRTLINGVVCGVRVENVKDATMQEIRYLDKLIDELAKGKAMEKILKKEIASGVLHNVPADLKETLLSHEAVLEKWNSLTPLARNEWICWTTIVKKPETRKDHIDRLCADLLKGKRRPCCWPGCPHHRPNTQKWFSKK